MLSTIAVLKSLSSVSMGWQCAWFFRLAEATDGDAGTAVIRVFDQLFRPRKRREIQDEPVGRPLGQEAEISF